MNVFGLLLNDSFILNEGVDVDQTSQESFRLADRGVLKDDDKERQVAVLNAFNYYASLNNSGMTLNKDLYTNEANNERGLASSIEKDLYTMKQIMTEKGSLNNQDCDTGFFLNSIHLFFE